MAFEVMERIFYQQGLFLTAQLCQKEQDYFRQALIYHNQAFYNSGTAIGLEVTGSTNQLNIAEGMAIDSNGNQLIWPINAQPIQLANTLTGTFLVYIQYQAVVPEQLDGNHLIIELPKIELNNNTQPPDPNLILAEIDVENGEIKNVTDKRTEITYKVQPSLYNQPNVKLHKNDSIPKFLSGTIEVPPHRSKTGAYVEHTEVFLGDVATALQQPPKIIVTPYTEEEITFALTLSEISKKYFTVKIMRTDNSKRPCWWDLPMHINWLAWQE